jgi:hypothetical protein
MKLSTGLCLVLATLVALTSALQFDIESGESWHIPMRWMGSGSELEVRTQSMCDGASWLQFSWDKEADVVQIRLKSYGLPIVPPRLCYEFDPSNAFNKWPFPCVTGRWQLYVVSQVYKIPVTCYYDATSKLLLGTDYDHYGNVIPSDAIAVPCNAMSMLTTPQFTPNFLGVADETFTFSYSDLRDEYGTSGTLLSLPLKNLSDPLSFMNLYTNLHQLEKPVPRVNYEDILWDINNATDPLAPGIVGAGLTYVPANKPAYLQARDNLMLGQFGMIDLLAKAPTYDVAQCAAEYQGRNKMCGTFQLNNFFPFLHGC